jgi:hypothetical protein
MTRPTMLQAYICDRRVGDGYRTAFVLRDNGETATLFVHSKLATVTVPCATAQKARVVPYRPAQVRANILEKARYFRQHGKRFPRQLTVELLRRLGAARASIDETVGAAPLPGTIAARERRLVQAERRIELAGAIIAIREKIDMQPEEVPTPAPKLHRHRPRYVHPDQLALAL